MYDSNIKDVRIIYNPQRDCLFSVLTIRESLIFACELAKYCGRNLDILKQDTYSQNGVKLMNDSKENALKVNEIIDQLGKLT